MAANELRNSFMKETGNVYEYAGAAITNDEEKRGGFVDAQLTALLDIVRPVEKMEEMMWLAGDHLQPFESVGLSLDQQSVT
mmetsp:Transcript_10209/g.20423  ORF Transcript_10209/g.20423 Transcript_10209/m.20423 type:complete len:81 (-) Transcript_10209:38-280(-)|eukprot:CAMPEP_0181332252 /NCGR_PEP_ID=MMETSP1101-20121128/24983_1 /TAXON_ID=46948 /ORGANISM="Rhodomonas abbreviata, Strain Caron Lab Isolate" /LENGTH=80 /DNA_ID=CAMNT_0023441861 /DNA_START=236 /DNA_END=478 /DNA_ORIENTATION=-